MSTVSEVVQWSGALPNTVASGEDACTLCPVWCDTVVTRFNGQATSITVFSRQLCMPQDDILSPRAVRDSDLVERFWPSHLTETAQQRPRVDLQLSMAPAGGFCNFRMGPSGSATWLHVISGTKVLSRLAIKRGQISLPSFLPGKRRYYVPLLSCLPLVYIHIVGTCLVDIMFERRVTCSRAIRFFPDQAVLPWLANQRAWTRP